MTPLLRAACLVALLSIALHPAAHAITIGQVDDFQDQTLQGWDSGGGLMGNPNPNPPLVAPICGPSGVCGPNIDYYARIQGNGALFPAPGRAVVLSNGLQWSGDYLAAGVTSITLDVNNLGTTDLNLRLAIFSTAGGSFALTDAITLAPHGTGQLGWMPISFDLDPANWTAVMGPQGMPAGTDINAALADVLGLRIVSSAAPSFQGDSVAGLLGVDNITAVPEPGTFGLVLGGLAALGWRRAR